MSLASSPRTLRLLGEVIEPPRDSVLASRAMFSVVSARWGKIQSAKLAGAKSITPPGALVFSTLWALRMTLAWISPPPLRQPSPLAPTTMVSAVAGRTLKAAMRTAQRRGFFMAVCYAFPPDLSRIRRKTICKTFRRPQAALSDYRYWHGHCSTSTGSRLLVVFGPLFILPLASLRSPALEEAWNAYFSR